MTTARVLFITWLISAMGFVQAASTASANADAFANVLAKEHCNTHYLHDPNRVGPPFRKIAFRYSHLHDRIRLQKKIKYGGRGNWGTALMPAHPQLSAIEIDMILNWVFDPVSIENAQLKEMRLLLMRRNRCFSCHDAKR